MAVILAFAPPARPRAVPVDEIVLAGVARTAGTFRWARDADSGTLACRFDAASADPAPQSIFKSA